MPVRPYVQSPALCRCGRCRSVRTTARTIRKLFCTHTHTRSRKYTAHMHLIYPRTHVCADRIRCECASVCACVYLYLFAEGGSWRRECVSTRTDLFKMYEGYISNRMNAKRRGRSGRTRRTHARSQTLTRALPLFKRTCDLGRLRRR